LVHQAEVAEASMRADAVSFAQTIIDRVDQHLARMRASLEEGRRAITPPPDTEDQK